MSDREKIVDLIKNYIDEKITTDIFANHFTILFSREIDYSILSDQEYTILTSLQDIASLFSPCADGLQLQAYRSESDVQKQAHEAFMLLSEA